MDEVQRRICEKYGTDFDPAAPNSMLAISKNFDPRSFPIHGLRDNTATSGWYLWVGDFSVELDFWEVMHCHHLNEVCPLAVRYLALPRGWRFLFDETYEDVWFDQNILR
jgi:hypothetical protein